VQQLRRFDWCDDVGLWTVCRLLLCLWIQAFSHDTVEHLAGQILSFLDCETWLPSVRSPVPLVSFAMTSTPWTENGRS
jgi:hypothetical protein